MTGLQNTDITSGNDGKAAHREQLSAMIDGGLSPDEARFLLRRMQHDDELADCWSRWQFYGDVMRGRAGQALPMDFPQRVGRAIADGMAEAYNDDAIAHAGAHRSERDARRRQPLLRWGGGAALAASVALVALVGDRMWSVAEPATTAVPVATTAAAAASPVMAVPVAASATDNAPVVDRAVSHAGIDRAVIDRAVVDRAVVDPSTVDAVPLSAAAAIAVAANTRRTREEARALRPHRMAAAQTLASGSNPQPLSADGDDVGAASQAPELIAVGDASQSMNHNPFRPQDAAGTPTGKPWPRALVPQTAMGGVTVDYNVGPSGTTDAASDPFRAPAALSGTGTQPRAGVGHDSPTAADNSDLASPRPH